MKFKFLLVLVVIFLSYGCLNFRNVENPDYCNSLKGFSKDNCYLKVAKEWAFKGDKSVNDIKKICDKIGNKFYGDQCYYNSAIYRALLLSETGENDLAKGQGVTFCNDIKDDDVRFGCLTSIALTTDDPGICNNIPTQSSVLVQTLMSALTSDTEYNYDYRQQCLDSFPPEYFEVGPPEP